MLSESKFFGEYDVDFVSVFLFLFLRKCFYGSG